MMLLAASLLFANCLVVPPGSDQVSARDLAGGFPEGTSLPETPVALAPMPGVRRFFGMAELGRVAARLGLDAAPVRDLCIERPVQPLDPARLIEAMHRVLPDAAIEILDYSRWGAPDGELEFPRAGLRRTSSGSFWNGHVRYAANRRFVVWAKVKITLPLSAVVSTEDLPAGTLLEPGMLRVQVSDEFPVAGETLPASLEEVRGRLLRRPVRAGVALRGEWLEPPRDIRRGDSVLVDVRSGGARLELEGRADGSGAIGETVWVVNPTSHRRFPARVEAPGKVSVEKESR